MADGVGAEFNAEGESVGSGEGLVEAERRSDLRGLGGRDSANE